MRSIPREMPSPLFEADAPLNSTPWLERPVVDGDRVLLAGGGIAPHRGMVTVLSAVDARGGARLWSVDLQAEARELFAGVPCPVGDGRVMLPIAEASGRITVELLIVDSDGKIIDRIYQGNEEEGRRDPTLQAVAVAASGDRYLVTWRGGPIWTTARRLSDRAILWNAQGWLCGRAAEVAILQNVTAEAELLARRISDGTIVWKANLEAPVVAHVSDSLLVVVDSHERRAETAAADQDWDEHLGSHGDTLARDTITSPTALVAIDPGTGAERWRHPMHADVTSVVAAAHAVCAIAARGREARLHRFTRDGAPLGHSDVPSAPQGRESDPNAWPALIAVDHTHVLWASRDRLVCEVLADPGRRVWELGLPVPGRGFHIGAIEGALAERSIAVADERVYLREKNRLWAWGPA